MILSMTGYGRAVEAFGTREITVELRSVNNRYLDCTVKLPRGWSYAEDEVKKKVKEAITRGKVDVFVTIRSLEGEEAAVTLNRAVVESYLSALKSVAADYGVRDDLSLSAIASLPDVFSLERKEPDEDEALGQLLTVVEAALKKFTDMRAAEGRALEADLRSRAVTVLELVGLVEQRSPVTLEQYRTRLTEKMREVLSSTTIDEGRILQEAAIYADKIAVDEETVRLRSHFDQMDKMLTAGGPVGRKLDFLLQEMNREANTIGSKGNDLEQARNVVAIKAELEKIREQVQNIE